MNALKTLILALVTTAFMMGAAHADAVKDAIDAAKASGTVGERWDGYVAPVNPPVSANLQQAIDTMNLRRKDIYEKAAKKTNATLEQAGVVFAENIITGLPDGYYYLPKGEGWTQK